MVVRYFYLGSCLGSCPFRVWFVSEFVLVSRLGSYLGSCPVRVRFVSGSCLFRGWCVAVSCLFRVWVRVWVRVWFRSGSCFGSGLDLDSCLIGLFILIYL